MNPTHTPDPSQSIEKAPIETSSAPRKSDTFSRLHSLIAGTVGIGMAKVFMSLADLAGDGDQNPPEEDQMMLMAETDGAHAEADAAQTGVEDQTLTFAHTFPPDSTYVDPTFSTFPSAYDQNPSQLSTHSHERNFSTDFLVA